MKGASLSTNPDDVSRARPEASLAVRATRGSPADTRRPQAEERLVVAALDDRAALQHEDLVGVPDRREAVGDDDRRPVGGEAVDRALAARQLAPLSPRDANP